jgi:hypothetical protein
MSGSKSLALAATALSLGAAAYAGCGGGGDSEGGHVGPAIGKRGTERGAARSLGFPAFATKNTTRVGGGDAVADAAGVAQAVYSGQSATTRPPAVSLVDRADWQGGLAASVLMSAPIRAPILLSAGGSLPSASADALGQLDPGGSKAAAGAQVIRIGSVPKPDGYRTTALTGSTPAALAQQIDRLQAAAVGKTSDRVVIASAQNAPYAMPAAAWAAKSGDPILFALRDSLPAPTVSALRAHQQPRIYVLGPPSVISDKVLGQLRRLGTVTRIAGQDPISNSIAFARFLDGRFGWGVVDPGHGLVFANARRPLDAAAAAPLSAAGTYGPLLLTDGRRLPLALVQYLLDIQPGYDKDPVRGVYNHGWLIGDQKAISLSDQARIDSLLEIVPVDQSAGGRAPSS